MKELYNYKGYSLYLFEEVGDPEDAPDIYYEVIMPNGDTGCMDWSGWYSKPSKKDFEMWIELGMPDRYHPALQAEGRFVFTPIDADDLIKIAKYLDVFENIW